MAMGSSKLSTLLFLLLMLSISSTTTTLACGTCPNPPATKPPEGGPILPPIGGPILPPIIGKPPITLPPVIGKPPITLPPVIGKPPITLPPVIGKPPITLPPVIGKPPITLPPVIGKPPMILPPVTVPPIIGKPPIILPPVTVPPIIGGTPPATKPGCPTPSKPETCPIDTLKLGACVDLLGGLTKINIGDPAANECCPIISGLIEVEAALCLCTTIKVKLLDVNVYLPIALQLLVTCGKTPPPGYTCP